MRLAGAVVVGLLSESSLGFLGGLYLFASWAVGVHPLHQPGRCSEEEEEFEAEEGTRCVCAADHFRDNN